MRIVLGIADERNNVYTRGFSGPGNSNIIPVLHPGYPVWPGFSSCSDWAIFLVQGVFGVGESEFDTRFTPRVPGFAHRVPGFTIFSKIYINLAPGVFGVGESEFDSSFAVRVPGFAHRVPGFVILQIFTGIALVFTILVQITTWASRSSPERAKRAEGCDGEPATKWPFLQSPFTLEIVLNLRSKFH
jgi:hypothetical protein